MSEEQGNGKVRSVRFEYEKTPDFQNIHVDGIFGGVGPKQYINMAVFNERVPIPKTVTHEVTEGGLLGRELIEHREGRKSIFRSVEANLIIDLGTAKSMHAWLGDH